MAETVDEPRQPVLFNSPLEAGTRALVVLDASYPKGYDLTEMTWLDHLVVHTADIGGPESLHPDVPHRSGELMVRRSLVEQGMTIMRRQHLIVLKAERRGLIFRASDDGAAIVENMRTPYAIELKERARWLAKTVGGLKAAELKRLVEDRIGRWNIEFEAPARRLAT